MDKPTNSPNLVDNPNRGAARLRPSAPVRAENRDLTPSSTLGETAPTAAAQPIVLLRGASARSLGYPPLERDNALSEATLFRAYGLDPEDPAA